MKTSLLIIIAFSSIPEIRCDNSETPLEELARITRHMNGLLGGGIFGISYEDDSFVYSGLRLMANLVSMYSVGSKELKRDFEEYLFPFSESLKNEVCEYMNMFTNFSRSREGESNLTFKSMLFYRHDMVLKRTIENRCFNNNSQSMDFEDTYGSEETINDWFNQFVNEPYLSKPLPEDTNVLFMNGIHMNINMSVPYGFSGDIVFTDLYRMKVNVKAMEKTASLFYGESPENKAFMIREDFVGGRFSSVIIAFDPHDPENPFKNLIINPDEFTKVLIVAMKMKKEYEMKIILPVLRIDTRHDLGSILEELISRYIFSRKDLLSDLTDDDSSIVAFPYGEFINIVPTVISEVVPVNKTVVINQSFIFVIMDRKYNLAVQTTFYTGQFSSYYDKGKSTDGECNIECDWRKR